MKDFFLTDQNIQDLINETKKIDYPLNLILRKMKAVNRFPILQNSYKFPRQDKEGEYLIYVRRNQEKPLDFSCGLGFIPKGRAQVFSLRRYNGKSHQHTNLLDENQPFYDFHIHQATERYQKSSYKDDHYATPTNRYAQLNDAFKCLLKDCKIESSVKDTKQVEMFG